MPPKTISTWTRFEVPPLDTIDVSIFKPLISRRDNYLDALYGRVVESPRDVMLVVVWKELQIYDAFVKSAQHVELLANLKTHSASEPITQIIDFDNVGFCWRYTQFGHQRRVEIRTVYFPPTISSQTREAVKRLKGLEVTVAHGIDGRRYAHLCPYDGTPVCGWIYHAQPWNEQDVSACVWSHCWVNEEMERKFKTTERRFPKTKGGYKPLAVEEFEQQLKDLGALGWEDYHIYFDLVPEEVQ
ncbi:hypothetical protein F4819DRAFT_473510 [Hypoxylon fuscum]|nr:hypothetical protein F4819DRAFT_473510 [Hypoxylon fuscum]